MPPLQRRIMKELLAHLDELNAHIKNLDDEIDNFMRPEEKQASQAIQDVTGIGNTSAQAIGWGPPVVVKYSRGSLRFFGSPESFVSQ